MFIQSLQTIKLFLFQCTFWCSVLSDERIMTTSGMIFEVSMHLLVLSAFRRWMRWPVRIGAGCVSMHLLVLSAFRHDLGITYMEGVRFNAPFGAQCFPTRMLCTLTERHTRFNAPFGAQCFPTIQRRPAVRALPTVSMHLLVLSAFRLEKRMPEGNRLPVSMHLLVLSAFRPEAVPFPHRQATVSMHLLVLSAFRPGVLGSEDLPLRFNAPFGAQCFPTVDGVLSVSASGFQCTFWCSVLSDLGAFLRDRLVFCFNAPFGAQCFPTES